LPRHSASRNAVITSMPACSVASIPVLTRSAAATSWPNQGLDRPGGRTVARPRGSNVPAVKPLAATSRTPRRPMSQPSRRPLSPSAFPHTSLPWHMTLVPRTGYLRARTAATGSRARCPMISLAGPFELASVAAASASRAWCPNSPGRIRWSRWLRMPASSKADWTVCRYRSMPPPRPLDGASRSTSRAHAPSSPLATLTRRKGSSLFMGAVL